MGLFRKGLSVSTLGAVDFRSDKERIARSARKGATAQQETNRLLRQQNKILSQAQRPASSCNPNRGWDFVYGVSSDELWAAVMNAFAGSEIRSLDDAARSLEAKSQRSIVAAKVGDHPQGSALRLRARASALSQGPGSEKRVRDEWGRLLASIEGTLPVHFGETAGAQPCQNGAVPAADDLVDHLGKLAGVHGSGLLSDEQYETAKEKLLGT